MLGAAAAPTDISPPRRTPGRALGAVAFGAGLLLGLSSLPDGLYAFSAWAPLTIVALLVVMSLVIAGRPALPWQAMLVAGGVGLLAAVQAASTWWAESTSQAWLEVHRTVLYFAGALVLLALVRERRCAVAILAGVAAGALTIAAIDVVLLLAGDPPDLLVRGRIDEPLGYSNGQAAAFLMAFFPCVAFAESARSRALAAAGVAGAAVAASMALLCFSRGAVIALVLASLAILAVLPGRGRRLVVLLVSLGAVAIAGPVLFDVYDLADPATGFPPESAMRRAALAVLLAGVGSALVWLVLSPLAGAGRRADAWMRRHRGAAALVALGCVAVAAATAGPALVRELDDRIDAFVELRQVDPTARLSQGGGNRYDYWRVAVDEWESRPLLGIGAGNYDRDYFRERRTSEDLRQPHSLELQVLAETGLAGLAALLVIVAGLLWAFGRGRSAAVRPGTDRGLLVASTGLLVLWGTHTSVDWLHLLPGLTLTALAAAAVLIHTAAWPPARPARGTPLVRPLLFAASALAAAHAGDFLVADHLRDRAAERLAADPAAALEDASRALDLEAGHVEAYYISAAALARFDRYDDARAALLRAEQLEPHDFVTPALLGDLAARRGDYETALSHYERALQLNPRNGSLSAVVVQTRQRAQDAP